MYSGYPGAAVWSMIGASNTTTITINGMTRTLADNTRHNIMLLYDMQNFGYSFPPEYTVNVDAGAGGNELSSLIYSSYSDIFDNAGYDTGLAGDGTSTSLSQYQISSDVSGVPLQTDIAFYITDIQAQAVDEPAAPWAIVPGILCLAFARWRRTACVAVPG